MINVLSVYLELFFYYLIHKKNKIKSINSHIKKQELLNFYRDFYFLAHCFYSCFVKFKCNVFEILSVERNVLIFSYFIYLFFFCNHFFGQEWSNHKMSYIKKIWKVDVDGTLIKVFFEI